MGEHQRRWYRDNAEHVKAKTAARKRRHTQILAKIKDVPCADCGQKYPHYVMDFDHVSGEKCFTMGHARCLSIERLLEEVEKCEVVCSNCHRERTFRRGY